MRLATALILIAAGGCTAGSGKDPLEDPSIADGTGSDHLSRNLVLRGTVDFGQSLDGSYADGSYTGYLFTGKLGARVVIDIAGNGTDPVLYLYGPQRGASWASARPIAQNDDYRGSVDSHIAATLPADGTYLILAREYYDDPGRFGLTLGCSGTECRAECRGEMCPTGSACNTVMCIRAPCPSYCAPVDPTLSCAADSDCVSIPTSCCPCSMGGTNRAVNSRSADSLTPVCTEPGACIALYNCVDERPACVSGLCQLVEGGGGGGGDCGGIAGLTCGDDEFCDYPDDSICGAADQLGTCRERPTVCTREFDPVCGCDGRTYSNRCGANAGGSDVAAPGECAGPPMDCRSTGCPSGRYCTFCWGRYACIPDGALC